MSLEGQSSRVYKSHHRVLFCSTRSHAVTLVPSLTFAGDLIEVSESAALVGAPLGRPRNTSLALRFMITHSEAAVLCFATYAQSLQPVEQLQGLEENKKTRLRLSKRPPFIQEFTRKVP